LGRKNEHKETFLKASHLLWNIYFLNYPFFLALEFKDFQLGFEIHTLLKLLGSSGGVHIFIKVYFDYDKQFL
jgi:hypothetical protein